jgi:hypothetical protein
LSGVQSALCERQVNRSKDTGSDEDMLEVGFWGRRRRKCFLVKDGNRLLSSVLKRHTKTNCLLLLLLLARKSKDFKFDSIDGDRTEKSVPELFTDPIKCFCCRDSQLDEHRLHMKKCGST